MPSHHPGLSPGGDTLHPPSVGGGLVAVAVGGLVLVGGAVEVCTLVAVAVATEVGVEVGALVLVGAPVAVEMAVGVLVDWVAVAVGRFVVAVGGGTVLVGCDVAVATTVGVGVGDGGSSCGNCTGPKPTSVERLPAPSRATMPMYTVRPTSTESVATIAPGLRRPTGDCTLLSRVAAVNAASSVIGVSATRTSNDAVPQNSPSPGTRVRSISS
jgi:hypothetical protein